MRKLIALILIASAPILTSCTHELSAYEQMKQRERECVLPLPLDVFLAGDVRAEGPLTVEQVEQRSFEEIRQHAPNAPQVPFGYVQEKWEAFKEKIQSGDVLYEFRAPYGRDTCALFYGASGIAVVRDAMVVEVFMTSVY